MSQPIIAALLMAAALVQAAPEREAVVSDVTGCVTRESHEGSFTLADVKKGTFELTGANVAPYVGKRVQLKGESRRLRISGGLYPSANVAAQAGTNPQALTFAAAASGATHDTPPAAIETAPRTILEFRVNKIRTLKGQCP